mmetsp:Transcript_14458/g.47474  ORF Transcript_14458/g.47474 Transcript_14458/m.47474 type:complete len:248 (+) Transcript_14458:2102-2845(+)
MKSLTAGDERHDQDGGANEHHGGERWLFDELDILLRLEHHQGRNEEGDERQGDAADEADERSKRRNGDTRPACSGDESGANSTRRQRRELGARALEPTLDDEKRRPDDDWEGTHEVCAQQDFDKDRSDAPLEHCDDDRADAGPKAHSSDDAEERPNNTAKAKGQDRDGKVLLRRLHRGFDLREREMHEEQKRNRPKKLWESLRDPERRRSPSHSTGEAVIRDVTHAERHADGAHQADQAHALHLPEP